MSERLSDEPLEPEFDPGLQRRRSEHGGMPRRDDDEFALAAERDRVAAGLEDYAPDDVPPAADPPPPGVSEAVDLAERGLLDDTSIDTRDRCQRSAAVSTVVMEISISRSWVAAVGPMVRRGCQSSACPLSERLSQSSPVRLAADNSHCGCPTWTANNALNSCCVHDHLHSRG